MKKTITTFAAMILTSRCLIAGPLDGIWINSDPNTESIPKIEITSDEDGKTELVWWGKTHPQDSRYAPLRLTLLGTSVADKAPNKYGYTTQESGFANMVFFVERQDDKIVLRKLTVFKDESGRSNYHQTLTFGRAE